MMTRRELFTFGAAAAFANGQTATPSIRIGVMDGVLGLRTDPEAVQVAAKLGFEAMQVTLGKATEGHLPSSDQTLQKRWREAARDTGLKISATYIDALHDFCLKNSDRAPALVEEGIAITKALGAPILMLVFFGKCALDSDSDVESILEPLRRLCPLAQKAGVTLALENTISAEANIRILDQIQSPALKVWYDIGNATNIGGFDIAKEIRLLGRERICEFHVKDKTWLGEGKVDLKGAARAAREIGYRGVWTLETSAPTGDRQADARKQLATVRAALQVKYTGQA